MPPSLASIGHASSVADRTADTESEHLGRVFQQTIGTVEPNAAKTGGKRPADVAIKEPGTYGYREQEKTRLDIGTGSNTHESEHVYGYAVVNPMLKRKSTAAAKDSENAMPAYHEVKELHRGHPGTGSGTLKRDDGWTDSTSYRHDQAATLTDPVALREGTAVSNGYQLNQLGYGHRLASDNSQYSGASSGYSGHGGPTAMGKANESYASMVAHDPAVAHSLGGIQTSAGLGPKGQAEALLAREAALSGTWPEKGRQNAVVAYFEEAAARRS